MSFKSADSDVGLDLVTASIWAPLFSRRVSEEPCSMLQADEEGSLEDLKSLWLLVTPGWCRLSQRSVGCTSPPQFQADSLVSPFLSPSQL